MSEEAIKRQRREIAAAAFALFEPFGYDKEKLDGNPFDIRIFHEHCAEEWELRCVPKITKDDIEIVTKAKRPRRIFKIIAYRPSSTSKKIACQKVE